MINDSILHILLNQVHQTLKQDKLSLKYTNHTSITMHLVLFNRFLWIFLITSLVKSEFPKIVWTYWEAGYNSYIMHKMFAQHIRAKIQHDGWEARFLNKTLALTYLEKIPGYSKEQFFQIHSTLSLAQHRSDYIRCMLITHYGGVYLDISSIMYEDMSWIEFENLRKNHEVQNKYGDEPDVLFFTNYYYGLKKTYLDVQLNQTFLMFPGYQIWFMAAKPLTPFLLSFCPAMTKAYLEGATTKEGYSKTVLKTLQQQNIDAGSIKTMAYLSSLNIMQTLLQRKQRQLDAISKENNSSRQLAVWHYKIWHIEGEKGPLQFFFYMGIEFMSFLTLYSVEEVKNILHITNFRYFLKLTTQSRINLSNYFISQTPFYNIYQKLLCFYRGSTHCTIYKDSFIHEYLIKGTKYEEKFNIVEANIQLRSPARIFETDVFRFKLTIFLLLTLCAGMTILIFILLRRNKANQRLIKRQAELNSYANINQKQLKQI